MGVISDYIKKELDKGFSLEKIKKALLDAGHDVNAVEKEISKFGKEFEDIEKKEERKLDKIFDRIKANKPLNITIVAVLALVILILGLIFTKQVMQPTEPTTKQMLSGCEKITDANEKNICILKASAAGDTTEFCSDISTEVNDILYYECLGAVWRDEDCRYEGLIGESEDECWYGKAANNMDMDLCYSVAEQQLQDRCFEEITEIAIEQNNIDLCRGNNNCYFKFGRAKGDEDVCYNLYEPDICFLIFAHQLEDEKICEKIDENAIRTSCQDTFIGYGDLIINYGLEKGEMKYYYNSIHKLDENMCMKLTTEAKSFYDGDEETIQDFAHYKMEELCYANIALKKADERICEDIADKNLKDFCISVSSGKECRIDNFLNTTCYVIKSGECGTDELCLIFTGVINDYT